MKSKNSLCWFGALLIWITLASTCGSQIAGQQAVAITTKNAVKALSDSNSNDWSGVAGLETNGLACGLRLVEARDGDLQSPVCAVYVLNNTTNVVSGCQLPSLQNIVSIDLLDSAAWPVEKTSYGNGFGRFMTLKGIEEWNHDYFVQQHRSKGGSFFVPPPSAFVGKFSIPQAFKLEKAGEYSLRVRMALMQKKKDVSSGKTVFTITWLPEVTAIVQVREGDLKR